MPTPLILRVVVLLFKLQLKLSSSWVFAVFWDSLRTISSASNSAPIFSSAELSKSSSFSSALIFFSNSFMYSYSRCLILFNNWVQLEPGFCSVLKLSAIADGFGALLTFLHFSSFCFGFL